jgi:sialic acid synthase SpsE
MAPLKAYVEALKRSAGGRVDVSATFLEPSPRERDNREVALKSIVSRRRLEAGHVLSEDDIYMSRPGTGISPAELSRVLGRALTRSLAEETPLRWDDLEPRG